jgi:hypothetical protein
MRNEGGDSTGHSSGRGISERDTSTVLLRGIIGRIGAFSRARSTGNEKLNVLPCEIRVAVRTTSRNVTL